MSDFDPLINALNNYKLKALSCAAKLKAIANEWTSKSVKEYKDQRIISSVSASSRIVSAVLLTACAIWTGSFIPIALGIGGVGIACGITQGGFNYKYNKLALKTSSEVENIKKELKDALDEIKKCIVDKTNKPPTTENGYSDSLSELILKLHEEEQNSLLGLSSKAGKTGSLINSTVKGAEYAKSAKLAMKSTSTPMKATFQFLSKTAKFTVVAGFWEKCYPLA